MVYVYVYACLLFCFSRPAVKFGRSRRIEKHVGFGMQSDRSKMSFASCHSLAAQQPPHVVNSIDSGGRWVVPAGTMCGQLNLVARGKNFNTS